MMTKQDNSNWTPFDEPRPVQDPHFPADHDLELSLLGTILVEPSLLDNLDFIEPSDFYASDHAEIYKRMRKLWADGLMPTPELIGDRDLKLVNVCLDSQAYFVSPLATKGMAHRIRDLAEKRRMIPMLEDWAAKVYNGVPSESILDAMEVEIDKRRGRAGGVNYFDKWAGQGITAADAAKIEITERLYVVEDVIREKSLSIFFGAPGDLKSALLMDMAINIANGTPWLKPLPFEGNKQRQYKTIQGRVLWLNYDQSHDDVIERFGAMARTYGGGENVTALSHSVPNAVLDTESKARALGDYCKRNGYTVVFVDCLLDVKGKADLQEADMGEVLRMWRLVAETGLCSVVIIAHSTKATGDLYGSQFIKSRLDHLYQVTRPDGTDVAVIESKKQRTFGESGINARWTYQHFDNTRTLMGARFWGDSTDTKPVRTNSTQGAIKRVLMDSPGRGVTAAELTDMLNDDREDEPIKVDAVRKAADRLVTSDSKINKSTVSAGTVYHFGELLDTK